MTVDELLSSMQGIIDEADASEAGELTDGQVARYEDLEGQLTRARKLDEVSKRHAAYKAAVPGQLVTGAAAKTDDTLDRAFENFMRTGKHNDDLTELRAQGELVGSEGGYAVPSGFRDKLVDRKKAFGGIASVAEEVSTATGNPLSWVTVDDTANSGEIVAEGATFSSGADFVFGTANLGAYKYASSGASTAPLRVSVELLQDAAFDVQGFVARKLGERIGRIQATHLVTGTGVSQPLGVVTGLTGTASIAATQVYADLVNYIHAVDPAYRDSGNCVWAFNDATLKTWRKILDTNNRPIVKRGDDSAATGAGMETLLGYPVVIDQGFANIASNSTTNFGVFGDIREGYVIRRVKDVTLVVNPWTRAAYGQVEFSAWARMDATQQNTNSYTALTGHS